jgi:hypothetical protein
VLSVPCVTAEMSVSHRSASRRRSTRRLNDNRQHHRAGLGLDPHGTEAGVASPTWGSSSIPKERLTIMQRVLRAPIFWIAVALVAAAVVILALSVGGGGGGGGGGGVGY